MAGIGELEGRLGENAVRALQEMCEERADRMARARARDATAVDGGFWYGNECHEMWTEANRSEELESLKKRGRLYHGHAPTAYWEKPKDPSGLFGRAFLVFKLKRGKRPSEALRAKGPWIVDCRISIERVLYLALLAELGQEIFDAVFAAEGPAPLRLGERAPGHPPPFFSYETAL